MRQTLRREGRTVWLVHSPDDGGWYFEDETDRQSIIYPTKLAALDAEPIDWTVSS